MFIRAVTDNKTWPVGSSQVRDHLQCSATETEFYPKDTGILQVVK